MAPAGGSARQARIPRRAPGLLHAQHGYLDDGVGELGLRQIGDLRSLSLRQPGSTLSSRASTHIPVPWRDSVKDAATRVARDPGAAFAGGVAVCGIGATADPTRARDPVAAIVAIVAAVTSGLAANSTSTAGDLTAAVVDGGAGFAEVLTILHTGAVDAAVHCAAIVFGITGFTGNPAVGMAEAILAMQDITAVGVVVAATAGVPTGNTGAAFASLVASARATTLPAVVKLVREIGALAVTAGRGGVGVGTGAAPTASPAVIHIGLSVHTLAAAPGGPAADAGVTLPAGRVALPQRNDQTYMAAQATRARSRLRTRLQETNEELESAFDERHQADIIAEGGGPHVLRAGLHCPCVRGGGCRRLTGRCGLLGTLQQCGDRRLQVGIDHQRWRRIAIGHP
jgi:hypothetical protein